MIALFMEFVELCTATRAALTQRGASAQLTEPELELIERASHYGMGPHDTACQIIADRADGIDADTSQEYDG